MLCAFVESPQRGGSNKYTKRMIHKKIVQKYHALDGSISSFSITANSI